MFVQVFLNRILVRNSREIGICIFKFNPGKPLEILIPLPTAHKTKVHRLFQKTMSEEKQEASLNFFYLISNHLSFYRIPTEIGQANIYLGK